MSKVSLLGSPASTSLLARYMLCYSSLCECDNNYADSILLDAKRLIVNDSFQLQVDNKYYSVLLQCLLHTELETNHIETYESMMVIPDNESAVSDAMSALANALDGGRDAGVYLCVVLKSDLNAETVDLHRALRVDWCIDSGFEYIEVDTALPMESWQDRDKFGVPRVLEALQSNRWQHMTLKQQQQQPQQHAVESTAEASSQNLMASVFNIEAVPTAIVDEIPAPHEDDDERSWNQMDDVLQMAQNTRAAVQAGTITDEQRRDRAAQIALQMCSLMNIMDDDSDEDDSAEEE